MYEPVTASARVGCVFETVNETDGVPEVVPVFVSAEGPPEPPFALYDRVME